jgi:hypothetical protein
VHGMAVGSCISLGTSTFSIAARVPIPNSWDGLPGVALGARLQRLFLHRGNGDERDGEARRGDKE